MSLSNCESPQSSSIGHSYMNFVKSELGDECEKKSSENHLPDPEKCDKLIDAVFNQPGIRGKLIIYDSGTSETPYTLLQNSISNLELQCLVEQDFNTNSFNFYIGNEIICNSGDTKFENKQVAKHELANVAFDILLKDCFLLKRIREHTDVKECDLKKNKNESTFAEVDFSGSIGHKMMLNMGWSGGGLGSKEQGRVENIQVYENIERRGLGNKNILKEVTKILKDFSNSNKFTILAFDSSFTKEEREAIHKTARRLNLKSKSEGKGDQRRITVSRKMNRWDIVRELLKAGGESSSYTLRIPDNFKHLIG